MAALTLYFLSKWIEMSPVKPESLRLLETLKRLQRFGGSVL